jgi:hypothetical protein
VRRRATNPENAKMKSAFMPKIVRGRSGRRPKVRASITAWNAAKATSDHPVMKTQYEGVHRLLLIGMRSSSRMSPAPSAATPVAKSIPDVVRSVGARRSHRPAITPKRTLHAAGTVLAIPSGSQVRDCAHRWPESRRRSSHEPKSRPGSSAPAATTPSVPGTGTSNITSE